jgi:hypothetical protein
MARCRQIVMTVLVVALAGAAHAFDRGQYDNVPADTRAWFKGVTSPSGVPCCDISDGHRTEYLWWQVPERAIIRNQGNPVGEAVVWYVNQRGSIVINCFVPADAV